MLISPSSLTLSSTVSTSGTTSDSVRSTKAFLDLLPLSTLPGPPPDRPSALSHTSSLLGLRSPLMAEEFSAMPPSGGVRHLDLLDVVDSASKSNPSASSTDTGTSTGTSPSSSSAFSSNSDVSVALASWWTTSLTSFTTPSAILSYSSLPLSTNSPSMSEHTSTTSPPVPTTPTTQTQLSTTPALSHSSPSSPSPSSIMSISSTLSSTSQGLSATPNPTVTVISSTTLVTSVSPPSLSPLNSPPTSTYTITSMFLGQGGVTTYFVTSSNVLSTQSVESSVDGIVLHSPGAIAAMVLGIVGAFAFGVLWFFCAHRRRRKLAREAALILPEDHAPRPFDEDPFNANELGHRRGTRDAGNPTRLTGPVMEERYAGILAALHSTEGFGKGNEGGSTGGVYGSPHDTATDMDGDDGGTRASSPTLALHANHSDDPQYIIPLSPPPPSSFHHTSHPPPPPSAYHLATRRKSSPGPDAPAWVGAYSVAPSYNSHYARSQTLGSGSRSGSLDALTRTQTGSEEPLLGVGVGKAVTEASAGVSPPGSIKLTTATDPGGNRLGLGSAFGSPPGSTYSPSGAYSAFQHDTSGSYGTRSASGSGSYGYTSSGAPSNFDALRKVSSQGALSGAYSHGHGQSQGFKFGFSRAGSLSSGNTEKKVVGNRHSFGVPPTSFRAWKDRGSATSDKEKLGERQSVKEKDWKQKRKSTSSASTLGSVDEKQGRGSPVGGVRGLLERLRRAGHTPSPHSSTKDLPSPTRASMDVDPELGTADRATPPPIQIQAATPRRPRRFSFILSNPDPHPPSPYSGAEEVPSTDTSPRPAQHEVPTSDPHDCKPVPFSARGLQPGTPVAVGYALVPTSSPAPTEESHLVEGLLHPRLQTQGCSDGSLRDFEDYSRPIAGIVKNRLYSTTTFATQDSETRTPTRATPVQDVVFDDEHEHENEDVDVFGTSMFRDVPRDSWFFEDPTPFATALHSPIRD